MVKVRKNIVKRSIAKDVTYSGTNSKKYIVIHETANTSKGANADAHGRLQANGNSRSASWHYTVDDKEVVQSFSDTAQCWHAGNAYYNKNAIGIEICVNSDGNFKKAVKNASELTKKLMKKYKVSKNNVIQHNAASGKPCPRYLRDGSKGINWNDFKRMLSGKTNVTVSKPSKPSKSSNTSGSVVDYMKSKGMDSSYPNREKLAKKYGIRGYKGTESQNIKLLNKLKGGKPAKSKKSSTSLPSGVLRRGSRGNDVKQLQRALNKAYFKVGKVDGIYGARTQDAVERFQKVFDAYNVDGVYGPRTKRRLEKVLK